jgi:uncharacterized protein (TIGR02246 family)
LCARLGWAAVRNSDVGRLASLAADDVVIVHGDGRCIRGKDELTADFLKAFESFRIDQKVVDPEIKTRGNWAFEIASVESTLTPVHGGETKRAITTTLVAMRRQRDGSWKVARVMGNLNDWPEHPVLPPNGSHGVFVLGAVGEESCCAFEHFPAD